MLKYSFVIALGFILSLSLTTFAQQAQPNGRYRLISPVKNPPNEGGLGMLKIDLRSDGTFSRSVGAQNCQASQCSVETTIANGTYTFKKTASDESIQFFDDNGIFLDGWSYTLNKNQFRLWLTTEGASQLTYVTTGIVKDLERWYPDLMLGEKDNGRAFTIEVGQALAIELPIKNGERWQIKSNFMDSLTHSRHVLVPGPFSPVPPGFVRIIFTGAQYSIGLHDVEMEFIGQDGRVDESKAFKIQVRVLLGDMEKRFACPPAGCVWLELKHAPTAIKVSVDQMIIATLPSTHRSPAECRADVSPTVFAAQPVSVWLADQPANDIEASHFIWSPKALKPGLHQIICSTPTWGTTDFMIEVVE